MFGCGYYKRAAIIRGRLVSKISGNFRKFMVPDNLFQFAMPGYHTCVLANPLWLDQDVMEIQIFGKLVLLHLRPVNKS